MLGFRFPILVLELRHHLILLLLGKLYRYLDIQPLLSCSPPVHQPLKGVPGNPKCLHLDFRFSRSAAEFCDFPSFGGLCRPGSVPVSRLETLSTPLSATSPEKKNFLWA
jgi:hypothetical protein